MTFRDGSPISPVPGVGLEGYAEEVTVPAGGQARLMVSGPAGVAGLSVAQLIHGDPNPAGPGYKERPVDWGQPAAIAVREQVIDFGSYVEIPNAADLNPAGGFTLALWFCPTLMGGNWHTLVAKWAPGELSYALYAAGTRCLTAAISQDGQTAVWATAKDFIQMKCWQFVALTYDPAGQMCLYQLLKWGPGALDTGSTTPSHLSAAAKRVPGGAIHAGRAPLLFGASSHPSAEGRHWAHFNGKIGHPVLLGEALDGQGVAALVGGAAPHELGPVLGCWDFAQTVTGSRVIDISGLGHDGRAVNAPGRAVTGPLWEGEPSRRFTEQPHLYNAIHFHDDDLDDAQWDAACEVNVPPEAPSGIYAARLERDGDRLVLPFIVRPPSPRSELAFLIPTLTWQAYGSNRAAYSYTEDGVIDRGLCLYDVHRDGSMVYYASRHRPTRSGNPAAGYEHWGAHRLASNLYLVDWLETKGFGYDVFADQDLHSKGAALLAPYHCLLLGSHPEYWTGAMLDALSDYIHHGGRVMYLGGNGLYWVTTLDRDRPHLIEVRKGGEGDYSPQFVPEPGETQHSTTLEVGGLWVRRGRPARSLVGVEHAANVMHHSGGQWGFQRLPASNDPRYAFVFEGVGADEVIGNFGLNLGSAAGIEMDAVQEWPWDERTPEPVVLARAAHEAFFPPTHIPVAPVAEIALSSFPGGGAVFAAGSITWTGSLSHNSYENNVSRITENVLRRFLEPRAISLQRSATH